AGAADARRAGHSPTGGSGRCTSGGGPGMDRHARGPAPPGGTRARHAGGLADRGSRRRSAAPPARIGPAPLMNRCGTPTIGSHLAVRLVLGIKLQVALRLLDVVSAVRRVRQCFLLTRDRGLEVARLGVGSTECVDAGPILPLT